MATKQLNIRLPEVTHKMLDEICESLDLTKTQALTMALDRLYTTMNGDTLPPVTKSTETAK